MFNEHLKIDALITCFFESKLSLSMLWYLKRFAPSLIHRFSRVHLHSLCSHIHCMIQNSPWYTDFSVKWLDKFEVWILSLNRWSISHRINLQLFTTAMIRECYEKYRMKMHMCFRGREFFQSSARIATSIASRIAYIIAFLQLPSNWDIKQDIDNAVQRPVRLPRNAFLTVKNFSKIYLYYLQWNIHV